MFAFFYSIFGFLFRILYSFIDNYGLALLIFTLFFRLIIMPTNIKQQKSSATQVRMQPKLKRIREKYQDYAPQERNQKIQEETNELYQREGYSAMAGSCLPLLFQLPILWGLYGVVREPLKYVLQIPTELVTALSNVAKTTLGLSTRQAAYVESALIANIDKLVYKIPATAAKYAEDIQKIRDFDFTVFGIDLGAVPDIGTLKAFGASSTQAKILLLIPLLSFATSMMTSVLSQMRQKKNNPNMENQQMMGCWILSNLFAFFQTLILGHVYAPRKTIARLMVDETIYRRSYEATKKPLTEETAD